MHRILDKLSPGMKKILQHSIKPLVIILMPFLTLSATSLIHDISLYREEDSAVRRYSLFSSSIETAVLLAGLILLLYIGILVRRRLLWTYMDLENRHMGLNEARLVTLVELSLMNDSPIKELVDYAVEHGVELTKSEMGYVAFVNEEQDTITMQSWSKSALEICRIKDIQYVYKVSETGMWGECVRQRKPIIANDYKADNMAKKGYPPGHIPIHRHMVVPVVVGNRIVAIAGVANKEQPYDNTDVYQLTLLIDGMWKLVQHRRDEERIERLAYFDPLTHLPNRTHLINHLEKELTDAIKGGTGGALIFIDIDNFKNINDTFGHTYGDELLVKVAERIVGITDQQHTVARIGGDEFTVLYTRAEDVHEIAGYAAGLIREFEKPLRVFGNEFHITSSIGVALYPDNGSSIDELLKCADMAMYRVKELGKKNYMFYNETMNDAVVRKMTLENNIRNALSNDEFVLHYQPQLNLMTGKITGFEALVRWNSPEHGLVNPGDFISTAEETGLIVPLGEWVLRTACRFNRELHRRGFGQTYISVNISAIQLMNDSFIESVRRILEETGLPAQYLEMEITESVLMESFDSSIRTLEYLRNMGIKVSLDDFGKGYSSLNYLKLLPISTLKIDKSFIDDISSTGKSRTLTGSIVLLAHKMGLKVIAEGVETQEQVNYLCEHGCDMIQGYIIGKPVPDTEVSNSLENWQQVG